MAFVATTAAWDGPLFDAHLHYNAPHVDAVSPERLGAALEAVGVEHAVIITRDHDLVETAMRAAPGVILPFLDVYRTPAQKDTWMDEADLPGWVRQRLDEGLATGAWRGIGELHLFADDRHSPVFAELVSIGHERGLPVMIHGDPAVIDRAYEIEPDAVILWAHAGTFPYPPLIADYLSRYPRLHVDLSMRSERLIADGFMPLEWQDLLIAHADRFLIGADTFSARRWAELDRHVADIREWLDQLPPDVADRIAYGNADRLFAD
ncbi:MAG: amidohydrolase [Thioalkalivibrio sp.]|nr:MAG: amidohydrolase [Thioalkalivibrio sp.]